MPGANANAVTGSVPQTRSQAGLPAAPTPAGIPHVTGDRAQPGQYTPPAPMICPTCKVNEIAVRRLKEEAKALELSVESANEQVADISLRLQTASGVTINARQAETILKLQKTEEIQRLAADMLEHENTYLRALCVKNQIAIDIPKRSVDL